MKVCSSCGIEKEEGDFHKDRTRKDGLYGMCKSCKNKKRVEKYNPEYARKYAKKYRKENKERVDVYNKKYREENKEYFREKNREHYLSNREEKIKYAKKYRKENKEHIREKKRELERKYRSTIDGKIKRNISQQLYRMMNGQKAGRKWVDILGYSTDDVIEHLKNRVPDGYVFEDYFSGKLHIDHIIPRCLYNHKDEDEVRKCWDLRNLRFLPSVENMKKNRFLDEGLVSEYGINDLLPNT